MTVGHALWPDLLTESERAALDPGIPPNLDYAPDVLVVGGGILGLATAVACARAELGSVVVLERDRLGAGASGGSAGQLLPEAHVGVDPPLLVELARLSLDAWRDLERSIPGGVGLIDVDWLALEPVTQQFIHDLPRGSRPLLAGDVEQLVPGLARPSTGVLVGRQARLNPLRALARLAITLPCVATGVEVQSVSVSGETISRLGTSVGEFRPRAVVFATGTAPRIDGLEVGVESGHVKGHMLVTEPAELRLPGVVAPLATSIDDDRLLIGGTLDVGDDAPIVRTEVIEAMLAGLRAAWPAAGRLRVSHQWACFRPVHADHLPIVDRLPSTRNAWFTSGHYKTGILMAPATGRAIAEWMATGNPPMQVRGLGLARFARP